MDSWIFAALVAIFFELVWIGSRLGTDKEQGGLPELLRELKELREEFYWFKDDKFAGHLFKEIGSNIEQLKEEFYWFKDDKFAGHLFKEMGENYNNLLKEIGEHCSDLKREITEINHCFDNVDASLNDLKEILVTPRWNK